MSTLLRSTLDAVGRGEQMPASLIADYREQLNAVDADAARMEALVERSGVWRRTMAGIAWHRLVAHRRRASRRAGR